MGFTFICLVDMEVCPFLPPTLDWARISPVDGSNFSHSRHASHLSIPPDEEANLENKDFSVVLLEKYLEN